MTKWKRALREIIEADIAYRNRGALPAPSEYLALRTALNRGRALFAEPRASEEDAPEADREFLRTALTHGVTAEQLPHALAVVDRVTGHATEDAS
jgi:hypothetical protein